MNGVLNAILQRDSVLIVGSGPNGTSYYESIPESAFVIACNKAILAPIKTNLWICEDASLVEKDWFKTAYHNYFCAKIFSDSIRAKYPSEFGFDHRGIWKGGNPQYRPGKAWGGATVSCRAVQIAAISGAKRIVLLGVDMSGVKYFDGTETDCQREIRERGAWGQAQAFDEILLWLKKFFDFEIYTHSQTALKVPIKIEPQQFTEILSCR